VLFVYRLSTASTKLVGTTRRGVRTRRAEVLQSLGASTTESDVNDLASDSTRTPDNSELEDFLLFLTVIVVYCSITLFCYRKVTVI